MRVPLLLRPDPLGDAGKRLAASKAAYRSMTRLTETLSLSQAPPHSPRQAAPKASTICTGDSAVVLMARWSSGQSRSHSPAARRPSMTEADLLAAATAVASRIVFGAFVAGVVGGVGGKGGRVVVVV